MKRSTATISDRTSPGEPASGKWNSRGSAWLVGAGVFVVALTWIAGAAAVAVWSVLLYDGAVATLIVACAALCGRWLTRPLTKRWSGNPVFQFALAAGAGLGFYALAMLLLGLAGWLSAWTGYGLLLAGAAPGLIGLRVGKPTSWLAEPARWGWALPWLAIPLAVAAAGATLPPGALWGDEPHGYDVLEYHLQVPREWYDAGQVTFLDHNAFSAMPFNVEMLYLLSMLVRGGPWAGMYTAQFMHLWLIVLAALGVLGIARPGERGGALGMLACGVTPWLVMLAPMAYNEGGILLFGTLAVALMVREGRLSPLVALYAGAFAGLAAGSKLTGVVLVAAALPVAHGLGMILHRRARELSMSAVVLFMVGAVLTISPWLIRTTAWTGNPVWPEATSLLGAGKFSTGQAQRWQAAHAPRPDQRTPGARLDAGANQIILNWRFGYLLLPLGVVVALRRWRDPRATTLLVLLVIQVIVWIGFTHLQGRFFVLAIPLAAMLVALAPGRLWQIAVCFVLAVQGIIGLMATNAPYGERAGLLARMDRYFSGPWSGAVGLLDFAAIQPEPVALAIRGRAPLILVGDAATFMYPMPSSRLYYRTVFDVPEDAPDAVTAWMVGIPGETQRSAWRLIAPAELRRFARTYQNIPAPPENLPPANLPSGQILIAPGQPVR